MSQIKQYSLEFGSSMLLYILAIFFSVSFLNNNPEHSLKVLVSVLPVLPALLATWAVIRHLGRLDEFMQRVQLMSFATSFALVGLGTFTYGFLENVGFPHIPYVWIFPMMIAVWGLTTPVIMRLYK